MSQAELNAQFEHAPLIGESSIRLVALESGAEDDPIRCSLAYTSLDDEPEYEALSYVWGDPAITTPIFLDGKLFDVTINLHGALHNLRNSEHDSPPRLLWIDAICINQRDVQERNHQVQRMGDIYTGVMTVIIWLGHYHEPCDDLLEFDERIGTLNISLPKAEADIEHRNIIRAILNSEQQRMVKHSQTPPQTLIHKVMSPARTIQSQSALVLCGRCSISREDFAWACGIIDSTPEALPLGKLRNILYDLHTWKLVIYEGQRMRTKRDLLSMIFEIVPIECTDPRDRIFGLVGIANTGNYQRVDYSASIRGVYIDWTLSQIQQSEKLNILNYCNLSIVDDFPSWVLNLECGLHYHHIDPILYRGGLEPQSSLDQTLAASDGWTIYTASASIACEPRSSDDCQRLHLSGLLIGNVGVVLNPTYNATEDAEVSKVRGERVGPHSLDPQRIFMIRGLELKVERHFGKGYLPEHPGLWSEFTDVLFRG
ncbi:uncharacterized protein PAC_06589 [Phialocephala subalpina]|uniref:Heterokaryon incompatibility domain-containing protein n=1 Tax=Phialocephala subalpina TaxID=576137 RepID=A0A1L7WV92_9HELO|nr:uncharacterized protein PAC_06589 [Phialocephala subalpina]